MLLDNLSSLATQDLKDPTSPKMPVPSKNGKVLFIDAYDSFSENIAALLCQTLGVQVTMIHIDTRIENLLEEPVKPPEKALPLFLKQFDAVVLGPGPGNPEVSTDVGHFSEIWKLSNSDIVPVLGICLGFQSLCLAHGGSVTCLPEPCHGHAKKINHCGEDIFADAGEVSATNYNSLEAKLGESRPFADTNGSTSSPTSFEFENPIGNSPNGTVLPDLPNSRPSRTNPKLVPLAWDNLGTLMSVKHVEFPYWGLQFHPESCKSNLACQRIIQRWWKASMFWSTSIKSNNTVPRPLLPPGHVWSRPLTPINIVTLANGASNGKKATSTLYEELQMLTTSSAQFVKSSTLELPLSKSRVAEFCRNLSQNEEAILESTRKGRCSIYTLPSPADWRLEYSLETSTCTIYRKGQVISEWQTKAVQVLDHIKELVAEMNVQGGRQSVPFWGGFIGFFSHEVGLDSLDVALADRETSAVVPDISLLWVERSVVINHTLDEVHIQSIRKEDSSWITEISTKVGSLACSTDSVAFCPRRLQTLLASTEIMYPDEESYKRKIQACQPYLHSGDSYELCLTTEAQITVPSHPENSWLLYHELRRRNPVPFSAFLHLGKTTILSSSPEQFLSWDRSTGTIDMVPMKGTVAKSPSMTLDRAKEILASPKESAENLMIADLIRHDLYSTVGWNASVEVVKLCEVVEHKTVYQLVSHIRATPPIPSTLSDHERQQEVIRYGHRALRQTLPPGSMTGAPKKRSCEILSRLEQRRRGVYSGVLGYLDVGGGGGFSVCIRTAVSNADEDRDWKQTWRVGAGGAITVLSDVDAEWREMNTKLESVLRAFRPDK